MGANGQGETTIPIAGMIEVVGDKLVSGCCCAEVSAFVRLPKPGIVILHLRLRFCGGRGCVSSSPPPSGGRHLLSLGLHQGTRSFGTFQHKYQGYIYTHTHTHTHISLSS